MTGAELLLRANSDCPPTAQEFLDWIRPSINRAAAGEDLMVALGLTRGALVKARDAAMREAAQGLGADGCNTWILAKRLSAQIARFESRYWPRLRAGLPVEGLSPVDAALHRVLQAEVRVRAIRSKRKVYEWLLIQEFQTAPMSETGQ